MADCDQALHAQRLGACSDALELGDANSAGLVQVDIDLDAMPVGDTEDDVELRLGVAVQGRRVDATDDLDAFANGRFHHFGSTGAGHHTGLGEGHQFDLDQILVRLPGFEDGAQVVQARGGVHVDMAAHGQGAVRRCLADQRLGALDDRRGAGQLALLHGQAFSQGGHRLVRAPTVTDEALVQVDMAVDEPRQGQQAFEVDGFAGRRRGTLRSDVGDAPMLHGDVQRQAIFVDGIDELTVVHDRPWPLC